MALRKQTHGRLPVILMDADRFKDWCDDPVAVSYAV